MDPPFFACGREFEAEGRTTRAFLVIEVQQALPHGPYTRKLDPIESLELSRFRKMTQSKSAASKFSGLPVPANAVVLLGMTVVAMALGVGFASHLGMPASAAITCAALIYVAFVVSHIAVVRGRKVAELEGEITKLWNALGQGGGQASDRPIDRQAQCQPIKDDKPASAVAASPLARVMARSAQPESVPVQRGPLDLAKVSGDARGLARTAVPVAVPVVVQAAGPAARDDDAFSLDDETALARAMAEPDEIAPPQRTVRNAAIPQDVRQSIAAPSSAPVPPTLAAAARTLDASTIHEMVKKLATETATTQSPRPAPPMAVAEREPEFEQEVAASTYPGDFGDTQPSAHAVDGNAITESVRALRAAADAMRPTTSPASPIEASYDLDDETGLLGGEETFTAHEDRLSLLAEALSADRMDVMLEPILGLKDQATRHYEISVCLRSADGAVLDPNDDRRSLGGTGILPLIDLAKLSRIAEVSRRLAERGKTGSVFAGFAGESLADDDFLNRFADVYQDRTAITEQLVVALAQEDVRVFAPAHWSMVKDLSGAGFRFALEHVTDLDMDFDALKSANIQYVKLDAEIYLRGLPASDGVTIPAADVYNFLADKGLSLIIEHITSEPQLMKIVDCGALYGQGRLFGGPRSVKAQVFTPRSAA